jgi:fluoride ion exporter CrcB/FEX
MSVPSVIFNNVECGMMQYFTMPRARAIVKGTRAPLSTVQVHGTLSTSSTYIVEMEMLFERRKGFNA